MAINFASVLPKILARGIFIFVPLCIRGRHPPLPEHGEVHQFRHRNCEDTKPVVQGDQGDEGTHLLGSEECTKPLLKVTHADIPNFGC